MGISGRRTVLKKIRICHIYEELLLYVCDIHISFVITYVKCVYSVNLSCEAMSRHPSGIVTCCLIVSLAGGADEDIQLFARLMDQVTDAELVKLDTTQVTRAG